jgi:hypothetical protein
MGTPKHKPRVVPRVQRLTGNTLHCIKLCRYKRDAEFISYLGRLDIRDRPEVYGRTLAWVAERSGYGRYVKLRHLVWRSGLKTCHVESEGPDKQ